MNGQGKLERNRRLRFNEAIKLFLFYFFGMLLGQVGFDLLFGRAIDWEHALSAAAVFGTAMMLAMMAFKLTPKYQ